MKIISHALNPPSVLGIPKLNLSVHLLHPCYGGIVTPQVERKKITVMSEC